MYLSQIEKDFELGLRHNPEHFYPKSFKIEYEGERLLLVGVAKRHIGKRFRIVAVLKPRARSENP